MGYRLKVKGERINRSLVIGDWSLVKGMLILFFLSIFNFQFSICSAQELLNYPLDTINGEEVYVYQVERSIGLYRIGVNFNVPQADIVRFNPQLRERGLHYGETLYLPTYRKVEAKVQPVQDTPIATDTIIPAQQDSVIPAQQDSVIPAQQDTVTTPADTILPDTRRVIELALLLPFESQQTKRSANAERMLEFYQGALLALHDVQNDSTLYRLHVYDSERSERRVNMLCDSTELDSIDGILGLVYPIQIERMAAWCDVHNVPLLVPFSDDIDLANRRQVMQFNATDEQEADSLCEWIASRDSITHCIAVDVRDADISASVRTLRKQMKARAISCQTIPLHDLMVDSCAYALDTLKENLIILHSDRYQQIRIVLPHLTKLQQQGFNIRLVSQYAWQKENIDMPQVYTSMFTAETDRETYDDQWAKYYVTNHVSDAPRFDLLGYDLMQAMIAWLNGKQEVSGMQSVIRWAQVGEGGWQNACVKVVEK